MVLLFLGLLFVSVARSVPPPALEGWSLVFEDEFNGNALDRSKWNPTYNWGNTHNHQAYCAPENVLVQDGKLRIKAEARRHPSAPATATSGGKTYSLDYTSGAIDTRNKFSVQYGYIEGRFKAPPHRGTWPAFWMLQDGWPPEIDILEIPHARNQHHYYLHYTQPDWYAQHGSAWDHEASFGGVHSGPDKSSAFYNYGVEWDSQVMNFYFNDQRIASYNRPVEISQTKAMYLIVNLAVGGWATSGGDPIEVTVGNPAYFESEWIRVWKRNELPQSLRLMSVAAQKCVLARGNRLRLGSCRDSAAWMKLVPLGGLTYRVNFGDKVLEIPNESSSPGGEAGLWGWNGKNHQRVHFEVQSGFTGIVARMKMAHSSHYLRMADDSLVIQDWNTSWPWNQNWRIITQDSELPAENSVYVSSLPRSKTRIGTRGNVLWILSDERNRRTVAVKIITARGRVMAERLVTGYGEISTSGWPRARYIVWVSADSSADVFHWMKISDD